MARVLTEQELVKQWSECIRHIENEIRELFLHHFVFWQVQKIIKNNERLSKTPSQFFDWMREQFVYSSTMFVRRQADRTKRTISFFKLLDEIHRHPRVLSREWFLQAWGYDESDFLAVDMRREGDDLFDEAVGKGENYLTKAQIKADMDALLANVRKIEDYANNYVAHRRERPTISTLPTFRDLRETMKFLEKLVQKYYLLITGWKMSDIEEGGFDLADDWKEIFTFAWIDPE